MSPVEPDSTHDITAARRHVFPVLNHAAATWLPVLVDLGYQGADVGYHHAIHKPNLDLATKAQNRFLAVLCCICERGNALLKGGSRYLRRVTCCPKRITQIARAALALTHLARSW